MKVISGSASLQVEVRGTTFDVVVRSTNDGWEWLAKHEYDERAEPCGDNTNTWAQALRSALRACDGMAPFRRYETE